MIDEFVRDEALYREAKALGLDEKDFGVRQRVIRQLEFINQGVVSSAIELTEDDLRKYLEENQEKYREPPTITFTHVFLSTDRPGEETAEQRARTTLQELNGESNGVSVPFHEAPAHGDRFLYSRNYVNKNAGEIKSHFGHEMQERLFALEPNDKAWRGPFQSLYGYHLVLVTKKTESFVPSFQELRDRLQTDAFQKRLDAELSVIERSVIDGYLVSVDHDLKERLDVGK